MTKEEMLSAIYNEMADKTLSDGCIIFHPDLYRSTIYYITINRKGVFKEQNQAMYQSSKGHLASVYYDSIEDIKNK